MSSNISNTLMDKKRYKNDQVINRDISELWNGHKNFKAKFHACNEKLEQFTLKVLKLRFFNSPKFNEKIFNNCLKSKYLKGRKIKSKGELALIKKAISIHLRYLQIEQLLYQENQYLKDILNNSYKIVIKEKNSPEIEIYENLEVKNVKTEEKCFKSGLEYILQELEDVSNKTKLKINRTLESGKDNDSIPNDGAIKENLKCPRDLSHDYFALTQLNTGEKLNSTQDIVDKIKIETGKSQNLNLQIDQSNSHFEIKNIFPTANINIQSVFQNFLNQPLKSLVLDIKPLSIKKVIDVKKIQENKEVASAKVQSIEKEYVIGIDVGKKTDIKRLKNINTLIPNEHFVLNYIRLFFPLLFRIQKSICFHDVPTWNKCDNLNIENEIPYVEYPLVSNDVQINDEGVTTENINSTCIAPEEGENDLRNEHQECLNLSEVKTVEFYDIPSNSDIHDYTISWLEQQNKRDFYYTKQSEKMESNKSTNNQLGKRKSIMKRSMYNSRYDDFRDYLKNIITYSEEFSKRDPSLSINSIKEKKRKRVINFPSCSFGDSSYAGIYNSKNIVEHKVNYSYRNSKLPKMPDMNKTYQIVFQQNMPQGFSLKFVKSNEKDVSTLIVSNRYPNNKPTFHRTRLYKR